MLDEVLKRTNPAELKPKGFRFFSGLEGHELVYEVGSSEVTTTIECSDTHSSTPCRRTKRVSACTGTYSQSPRHSFCIPKRQNPFCDQ